jgi:hypothetical protein
MSKKTNPFFLKRSIKELEDLSDREQRLVLGIAKLTLYVHKKSNTAEETVQNTYPNLRPHLKQKVALALGVIANILLADTKSLWVSISVQFNPVISSA